MFREWLVVINFIFSLIKVDQKPYFVFLLLVLEIFLKCPNLPPISRKQTWTNIINAFSDDSGLCSALSSSCWRWMYVVLGCWRRKMIGVEMTYIKSDFSQAACPNVSQPKNRCLLLFSFIHLSIQTAKHRNDNPHVGNSAPTSLKIYMKWIFCSIIMTHPRSRNERVLLLRVN